MSAFDTSTLFADGLECIYIYTRINYDNDNCWSFDIYNKKLSANVAELLP